MDGLDSFRNSLEGIIGKSRKEAEKQEARRKEDADNFQKMLLEFDRHADILQERVVQPRMTYLASLFGNASPPDVSEEEDYRHRIHVHFGHSDEFPCTADVTFFIVHDQDAGHYMVKFEFMILPAYVTDKFKASLSLKVAMGEAGHCKVEDFVEDAVKAFLTSYLKTRRA